MDYYKSISGHKLCNKPTSQQANKIISFILFISLLYALPLMTIIKLIVASRLTTAKPILKTSVSADDMEKTLLDLFGRRLCYRW